MGVGRRVVVSGAGRGIGRGIALGLAAAGWDVGLVGRTRAHLDAVADEIARGSSGARTVVAVAELTDAAQVRAAVADLQGAWGGIDLLVNNAGVIEHAETDFAADDVEDAWRVVETNVRGPMLLAHAVLPDMLVRGSGRLLQISSGAGYSRSSSYTGYGISKGALARLTTLLDAQYRDRGIRTLDLAPGVVATDMTAGMPVHAQRTAWTSLDDVVALVRAFGDGELDALSGRLVRAGADTVDSLRAAADRIVAADARRLRVPSYGTDDPLA
ncbi:SDR family NAD(P)-dependent oxidoreductase [Cellulomonas sp.]|uniref:SDR family NAD(P)-dependent oxidoreductase n=1 Tax=Cellulomonas sp. TaxID=40001 RepID=UPI00258F5623|nr:SDR family NAD(P)-dependent oxidoreductase [Cellulomonas sp.]MCR6690600.1 SDR family oxidoreductase [Cellulomonas sp.]